MPLEVSASKGAFKRNVKREIAAGDPPPQAVAVAYSEKRKAKKKARMGSAIKTSRMKEKKEDKRGGVD